MFKIELPVIGGLPEVRLSDSENPLIQSLKHCITYKRNKPNFSPIYTFTLGRHLECCTSGYQMGSKCISSFSVTPKTLKSTPLRAFHPLGYSKVTRALSAILGAILNSGVRRKNSI